MAASSHIPGTELKVRHELMSTASHSKNSVSLISSMLLSLSFKTFGAAKYSSHTIINRLPETLCLSVIFFNVKPDVHVIRPKRLLGDLGVRYLATKNFLLIHVILHEFPIFTWQGIQTC